MFDYTLGEGFTRFSSFLPLTLIELHMPMFGRRRFYEHFTRCGVPVEEKSMASELKKLVYSNFRTNTASRKVISLHPDRFYCTGEVISRLLIL